jgi:signal peptidase I
LKAVLKYVFVVALAIVMAIVVRRYYLETYVVQSVSMNKTLIDGDKLLVIKTKNIGASDVVVFLHNQGTYVKRLIGLPGDTIEIIDRVLYVNHKREIEKYVNASTSKALSERVDPTIMSYYGMNWTVMNFGPYTIPHKDSKMVLNEANFKIYKAIINSELGFDVPKERMMGKSYVFKNDYYFMLGDNRLFSEDSRMYGPVTKMDVIGKTSYILFSESNILRRLFKKI